MLIDTHCHLNDRSKFPNVDEEIAAAAENGVQKLILVGTRPEEWEATVALTEHHPACFSILGWHPNYTGEFSPEPLSLLYRLLTHPKCLALGEVGLDYHWDYSPHDRQREALVRQLDLAQELNLPVVFHARDAYSDVLSILEARPVRPYLFHCFTGNSEDAARATALGCYFGIDGPVTYKKAEELRAVLQTLSVSRIVLETDAPYLAPAPFRGKPNRPAYIPFINQAVADLFQISPHDCARTTTLNAYRFFGPRLGSPSDFERAKTR